MPRRLTDAPASLADSPGVPTGIDALDRMTGGLPLDAVSTLSGLPGMGSTALALLIALENVRERRRVVYVSLDSGRRALARRLIGLIAGRNPLDLRHGGAAARGDPEVWGGAARLGEVPLWLHAEPRLTIDALEERLSRGPGAPSLVVIDPVTLVEVADDRPGPDGRAEDRWEALAELAHSSGSAWLWVAPVDPSGAPVKGGPHERLTLQDLPRGLVQAADLCMAVHRPAYHDLEADLTEAELSVLWNEAGPIGSVDLRWSPGRASFSR